jgi:pimeloyl-ACP methyl ester carboxylesterase/class 3 adenylate cyclase
MVGSGPIDLVFVMGWVSNIDQFWTEPSFARFLQRLATFSRLILFDKRGTGLSDRVVEHPTIEERMDDVRAVMDAVGSSRAALLGISEGAAMCILFAATYPERTSAVVIIGGYGRRAWAPDYPWGVTVDEQGRLLEEIERGWGGVVGLEARAPALSADADFRRWWAAYLRAAASPSAALAITRMNYEIDVRNALSSISVPTIVLHRTEDRAIRVGCGRHLAEHILGARYVELPGADHLPFVGNQNEILDEIELFLTGARPAPAHDRVLTTVLNVEIVDAAESAARLGDRRWREIVDGFAAAARAEVERFRGRVASLGEGSCLATFDGPARGIRCASTLLADIEGLGVAARAGLHSGECEMAGDNVGGIAVHIASRVMNEANSNEILVSSTVRDLVAGSGIAFEDRGPHPVRGIAREWRLLAVPHPTHLLAAPAPSAAVTDSQSARLTRREREVAVLVALGLTNRQIAERLVLSAGTAERHVANILSKLDYHSRAQIAAWAVEHGLPGARAD